MRMSAQISVYPLRQEKLSPSINAVKDALAARGLNPEVGPMSTVIVGDSGSVFLAIQEAFEAAATEGDTVMTFTVSNACPT